MVVSQRIQQLKEKVALLPDSPGVYQFLGADGKVIYVGKAKSRLLKGIFFCISQWWERNGANADLQYKCNTVKK